jgi:hypothetical protein
MKKILSMLLIAGMATFIACGPSAKEKEAKAKATADSIAEVKARVAADSIAQVKAKAKADSIAMVKEKAKQDSIASLAKKTVKKVKTVVKKKKK